MRHYKSGYGLGDEIYNPERNGNLVFSNAIATFGYNVLQRSAIAMLCCLSSVCDASVL